MNILFQLNYKMIFGFVIKMTTNEALAQDITQETFLKAVLNIKKFNCNCKFSTWLIRISINIYKDYIKKNKNIEFTQDVIATEKCENMEDEVMINLQYKEAIEGLRKMSYKKIVKTLNSNTDGNEDIKAESDGEYTINVKGYETRGSYDVNWRK